MMALLVKKLYVSQNLIFRSPISSSASKTLGLSPKSHFMVEYLMSKLGFSLEEATKASNRLSRRIPHENPDAVLNFLRTNGFEDAQIKKLMTCYPTFLGYDVEESLKPKFRSFQDLGFSGTGLVHMVLANPCVLHRRLEQTVLPAIKLWKGFLGSEKMIKFFSSNLWLLSYSMEKRVLPNLTLLRQYGIHDDRIALVVRRHPRFIVQRPEALKELVKRAEQMGISGNSKMFLWALNLLRMVSKDNLGAKLKLMKSLGWSEADFLTAFRISPNFLSCSEKVIQSKMEFLVKEAGYMPSEVAHRPSLLMHSLQKRLIPRHHVMQVLRSKGLHTRVKFYAVVILPEKKFIDRFLLNHKDEVPELLDWYVTSCRALADSNSEMKQGDKCV